MLRTVMLIGAAMALILPGSTIMAQTALEQTEKQEMRQTGSQAGGEQDRVQDRTRTREMTQTRDDADQNRTRAGQNAEGPAPGDRLQDRDQDRLRDRDKDQLRDRDRLHDGTGSQNRRGGR